MTTRRFACANASRRKAITHARDKDSSCSQAEKVLPLRLRRRTVDLGRCADVIKLLGLASRSCVGDGNKLHDCVSPDLRVDTVCIWFWIITQKPLQTARRPEPNTTRSDSTKGAVASALIANGVVTELPRRPRYGDGFCGRRFSQRGWATRKAGRDRTRRPARISSVISRHSLRNEFSVNAPLGPSGSLILQDPIRASTFEKPRGARALSRNRAAFRNGVG